MIALKCAMGARKRGSAKTPYIETDGVASYMDLGFVPESSVLKVDIDFMLIDYPYVGLTGNFRNVIYGASKGTSTSTNGPSLFVRWSSSRGQYAQFAFPTTTNESINFGKGERIHAVADSVGGTITVNDATVAVSVTTRYIPDANMRLGVGYPDDPGCYSRTRFYSAKFYEDGVLIRDLVPYSGPRGVGMLDKVNNVLYQNANTSGTLTYGEEEASSVTPYIETDGVASYMDLGNQTGLLTELEITFKAFLDEAAYEQGERFHNVINCGSNQLSRRRLSISPRYGNLSFRAPTGTTDIPLSDRKFDIRISANSVMLDGEPLTVEPAVSDSDYYSPLLGTTVGEALGASGYIRCRYYSVKFWENGVLVRDCIPYSGPRGVGLLDKVNDVLYTNANTTGSLTYGEE